jgi:penicillin-binding protein 1A
MDSRREPSTQLLVAVAALFLLVASLRPCGAAIADPDTDLPHLDRLEIFQPGEPSLVYSLKGEPFASLAPEYRIFTPLERIPKTVREAVLDAEDAQFYHHGGISLKGMARAAIRNLASAKVKEGGSTITQQLAKSLFLSPDRTWSRKVKEFQIAREIEKRFSKDKILEMYLNAVYFGSGAYGIEAAARTYFSKSVGQLNLAEASLLAGLVKAPGAYSPLVDAKKAKTRRDYVLGRMQAEGHLTEAQAKGAKQQPVTVRPLFKVRGTAPYFVDFLRKELEARYGRVLTAKGGLRVHTTLDLDMQREATETLRAGVKSIESALARRRKAPAADGRPLEAALVALDPMTGEIRAMVGGLDYGRSQFNRAVQAKRQPGSAFKPFIYAAAFERGYAPTRLIGDYPVSYTISQEGRVVEWSPENYDRQFRGAVTLRRALEESINVPTVRLLEAVGVDAVIALAHRAGIRSELRREYALALGVSEVSPLELTSAYMVFANGGMGLKPVGIRQVAASNGEIMESASFAGEPVLREEVAFIVSNILEGAVERGTGRSARVPGWSVAAKTGTSQDATDLWLVGFTPRLVTGVWVGADQPRPLGSHETAGRLVAPVWANFMRQALRGESPVTLPIPEGVLPIRVNYRTGDLAGPDDPNGILEYVLRGEVPPGEPATPPVAPGPPLAPPSQPFQPIPPGAGGR